MKRNESILDFQRRLISVALRSPREEALNMFGIIWTNIVEFAKVRIPLDTHPEEIIPQFVDLIHNLDSAVQRKFPKLYMANSVDNIDEIRAIFIPNVATRESIRLGKNTKGAVAARQKIMDELMEACKEGHNGLIRNGMFYHKAIIRHAIAPLVDRQISGRRHMTKVFYENCDADKISIPESMYADEADVVNFAAKWIEERNQNTNNPKSFWFTVNLSEYNEDSNEDQDVIDGNIISICLSNPLIVEMNRTAKQIRNTAGIDTSILRYADSTSDDVLPFVTNKQWELYSSCFMRNPNLESPEKSMVGKILTRLSTNTKVIQRFLEDPSIESEIAMSNALKTARNISHRGIELYQSFMTVYRTGDGIDLNRRFMCLMARTLKENAHFMIELRARGDEANNLDLYYQLKALGADVHVRTVEDLYITCKVHGKVWSFVFNDEEHEMRTMHVFSTGNYSEAYQKSFADSVMIVDGHVGSIANFWEALTGAKIYKTAKPQNVGYTWSGLFKWRPGAIRETLIGEIKRLTMMTNKFSLNYMGPVEPFIRIKVNHITDPAIIKALISAANSGVRVEIIARTTSLISTNGTPSNLTVRSIAGRYLEHDRYFIFGYDDHKNGNSVILKAFMSSSDLMERNLDKRIEYMVEATDAAAKSIDKIFRILFGTPNDPMHGVFNFKI